MKGLFPRGGGYGDLILCGRLSSRRRGLVLLRLPSLSVTAPARRSPGSEIVEVNVCPRETVNGGKVRGGKWLCSPDTIGAV